MEKPALSRLVYSDLYKWTYKYIAVRRMQPTLSRI